ncbi:MAG TPA: amidophosphoribosyltransferase, partial [Ilumatobacteraceae bacterium]|nr:amidophosphoribosyltransferase [Ilumatobacteraceae bacterium]
HDGDLMAARLSIDEMREHIGADSLAFLSLEGMMRAIKHTTNAPEDGTSAGYCNACFTGDYPMPVHEAPPKLSFEGALA